MGADQIDRDAARIRLHKILLGHVGPENKVGMGALYTIRGIAGCNRTESLDASHIVKQYPR